MKWYITSVLYIRKLRLRSSDLSKGTQFEGDRARIQTYLFLTPMIMPFSSCQPASLNYRLFYEMLIDLPSLTILRNPRFIHFKLIPVLLIRSTSGLRPDSRDILLGTQNSVYEFLAMNLKIMYFLPWSDSVFSWTFQENRTILQEFWKWDWKRTARTTGCSRQAE